MANLDVDNVRFTPVRLRTGYDMGDVDAYLDQVKAHLEALDAAVAGTGRAPGPLKRAAFAPVRLREGYDIGEVDGFLAQVDAEDARLRSLARSGIAPAASRTTDPVGDPSAPAVVVDVSAPTASPAAPVPEPLIGNLTTQPLIREVGSRSTNLVLVVLVLAALVAMVLVILLSK
ncbi:DivIVA domain-containing protein [Nocardioides cavernaquae]|uniref:DivIVA domain-containing protein n=1 Tax=Nocardioides cavernaquae TaxID=2321396 RepID=UPI002367D28E|nr:DivIVA domain-containing protein [Nocardioides cavernaquae]